MRGDGSVERWVDQVVGAFLLKSDKTFYLFYATLSRDVLLKNRVFGDMQHPKEERVHAETTSVNIHLNTIYNVWVKGESKAQRGTWQKRKENMFKPPVVITPMDKLPLYLLDEIAHPSPKPQNKPSEERMAQHRADCAGRNTLTSYFSSGAGPSGV